MIGDRLYLEHIAERIRRINEIAGAGQEAFLRSHVLQDAVIRNFEVIGEAAKRLSTATQASAPEVPWRRISGFRNFLIHGYMSVDIHAVWKVIERDLPTLAAAIDRLLKE